MKRNTRQSRAGIRYGGNPPKSPNVPKGYTLNDNYDTDEVFAQPYTDTDEERLRAARDKHHIRQRMKTIKSGMILESEIFPIWDTRSAYRRAPKRNKSREAQTNLNNKNAVKHVVRLINANFTAADIWLTVTYDNAHLPPNAAAANGEMQKYLRRLKRRAKNHGFAPLKYIFVTEFNNGSKGGKIRVHHHLVINFPDRDIAESMWYGGARTQARRLQPDEFGFEGLGRYITKNPNGTRRYTASRNLYVPQPIIADHRMTRRKAEKIADGLISAKTEFERIYKGYEFTDIKTFTSDYVSGTYIYVRMRKKL